MMLQSDAGPFGQNDEQVHVGVGGELARFVTVRLIVTTARPRLTRREDARTPVLWHDIHRQDTGGTATS